MDIEAAKTDVQTALRRLPRSFVLNVAGEVKKNKDVLFDVVPKILQELGPHFKAAMMEMAMGCLDVEALESAGMELLNDFVAVDLNDHNSTNPEDHPDDPDPENA